MLGALHAVLAGAWIGLVLVKTLVERALAGPGHELDLLRARLLWQVDRLAQLPLLLAVTVSGARLLRTVPLDGLLRAKLACAALAIFSSLYGVWLVRLRLKMAEAGAWGLYAMIDRRQRQVGVLALLGLLATTGLGLRH